MWIQKTCILKSYGIANGKDEIENDHCDDLDNDVPQNRENQREDHHLLADWEYEEDVSPQ